MDIALCVISLIVGAIIGFGVCSMLTVDKRCRKMAEEAYRKETADDAEDKD